MSTTLHEAIAAVRAGDMEQAQLLAADVVRENPNDPNGWYLLSQLVDSDARRAAYLGKTLALDPQHARARMEFDSLPPALVADLLPGGAAVAAEAIAEAEPFAQPPSEDAADWMAEAEVVAEAEVAAEAEPVAVGDASADVPDWLQPLAAKPVPPSTHLTPARPAPAQPAAARKPAAARTRKKNTGNQALSLLLGLLLLLTVLVVAFLIYLLLF